MALSNWVRMEADQWLVKIHGPKMKYEFILEDGCIGRLKYHLPNHKHMNYTVYVKLDDSLFLIGGFVTATPVEDFYAREMVPKRYAFLS